MPGMEKRAADCDVLIVGGGLNGPALALALAQAGLEVILLDALPRETREAPAFDGRAYALSLASERLLRAIGIWRAVAGRAQPITAIEISDGRPGETPSPLTLHFDGQEIDTGPMGQILKDRFLRSALLAALDATPGVRHHAGVQVTAQAVDPGRVTVTLASGETHTARLLIGCDGRSSGVARRAGIGRRTRDYDQTSLVCAIAHERPHGGVAHQTFFPPGPLALLPLPGNRCSIVWTERTERARIIAGLDEADYLAVLRPRFGDHLGAIALAGERYSYPLALTLADSWTRPRVALVGDAAHGVHPLAGQGLNIGLRDVAALAEVLVTARRRGEDIGASDVLERYARWRRFDTGAVAIATDAVNRIFSNDNPILRLGRDLGLGLVNQVPAARRMLISEAAGLTGDLPRLMRGEPL